ncbi:MAG TPA: hypothetical protein VF590_17305 [Isosphaeraceae bacterium]|jgi:hypothetical protein
MDARPNTRRVDRERKPTPPQPPRGAKQIVIPVTRPRYDEIWHHPERIRGFVDGWVRSAPELFPAGFHRGYRLHGFGRQSRKLPGLKLRKVVTDDASSYWLRPSFITSYMTGTIDELACPLLLAAPGVPAWLLTIGRGHSERYWHRAVERLGRSSIRRPSGSNCRMCPESSFASESPGSFSMRSLSSSARESARDP